MKRKDVLNLLFWILLILVIILILWRIFGNSPPDLSILLTALLAILLKLWVISEQLKDFKHEVKFSFYKAKENANNIETRVDKVETKLIRK